MQSAGSIALTRNSSLQGTKEKGIDDGVKFQLKSILEIMDEAEYPGSLEFT